MTGIEDKIKEYENKKNELQSEIQSLEVKKQVLENEIERIKQDLSSVGVNVDENLEETKQKIIKKIEELEAKLGN